MFKIEVFTKEKFKNSKGELVLSDILSIGVRTILKVRYSPLYVIDGNVNYSEVRTLASELLSDKITETYVCKKCIVEDTVKNSKRDVVFFDDGEIPPPVGVCSTIKIWYKKNVTDPVSESILKAIKDLGIVKEFKVKRVGKYYLYGKISRITLHNITAKLLVNTLIQEYMVNGIYS
ncbi:MAG: phosphoribosylformylglycinamidine synthase subunit PurS [Endomicrobium sp.]|jgi:phosphoribosylformylglycinamidine synthase|nr:phosphoribosylformylglycinamidine synthase subunit PurS [Endomicrobium sp.]